jgi:hypothetical protein
VPELFAAHDAVDEVLLGAAQVRRPRTVRELDFAVCPRSAGFRGEVCEVECGVVARLEGALNLRGSRMNGGIKEERRKAHLAKHVSLVPRDVRDAARENCTPS